MNIRIFILLSIYASMAHAQNSTNNTNRKDELPSQTLLDTSNSGRSIHLNAISESHSEVFQKPLFKGNSEIGGSVSYQKVYQKGGPSDLEISGEYAYFMEDQFSIGPAFSFFGDQEFYAARAGAVSSFYFFDQDKQAARIQLGAYLGLSEKVAKLRVQSEIRYEFFFVSHASFGPYLRIQRYIRDKGRSDYNVLTTGANFSLYL